jgi:lysophospholipase L1-like esterase
MRSFNFSWFRTLLTCAAVFYGSTALGQSLSIIRKGATNYAVEATAPANNPHSLQASENLRLWVDVRSEVKEPYSLDLDNSASTRRYYRLIPRPSAPEPIRLLIISDSMASDCCGWGGGIYDYFNQNVTVVNYAMAWAGTKVFLQSAEMEKMMLIKPNYVLMQYGFIDGGTDADRSTTLPEFEANLRTIIDAVRSFNGVPVLITLHAARLWDENGKVIPTWQERNEITKRLAAELKTPLIDLYEVTEDLFNDLGPTGTAFMHFDPLGPEDFMHFSTLGAKWIARIVANDLPPELGPYLSPTIFDPPPKP